MPELPEIEALRRYLLRAGVVGRTVVDVDADWPGVQDTVDGMGGLSGLPGRRIEDALRHGKQLILPLSVSSPRAAVRQLKAAGGGPGESVATPAAPGAGGFLGLHMGMTGRLAVMAPEEEPFRYRRVVLYLDDERRIELDDVRRWAMVRLEDTATAFTGGLGPDALDPGFTAEEFAGRVSGKRSAIKSVLLDQHVLAGVGNIYADEALLLAGISPSRRADRVSAGRLDALHGAIVSVLDRSLAFIESHPDEHGRPYVVDAHDERMQIPRRAGAPCPRCDGPLKSRKFGGRTAYYCPACQR